MLRTDGPAALTASPTGSIMAYAALYVPGRRYIVDPVKGSGSIVQRGMHRPAPKKVLRARLPAAHAKPQVRRVWIIISSARGDVLGRIVVCWTTLLGIIHVLAFGSNLKSSSRIAVERILPAGSEPSNSPRHTCLYQLLGAQDASADSRYILQCTRINAAQVESRSLHFASPGLNEGVLLRVDGSAFFHLLPAWNIVFFPVTAEFLAVLETAGRSIVSERNDAVVFVNEESPPIRPKAGGSSRNNLGDGQEVLVPAGSLFLY